MRRLIPLVLLLGCTSTSPPSDTTKLSWLITPTYVRSAVSTPGTATSTNVTLSGEAAGDINIVMIGWFNTTSTVTSLVDNQGDTYQLAVGPTQFSGATQSIYYAKNIHGGSTTVTVTFSASAPSIDFRVAEYTGVDKTAPFDVGIAGTGNNTNANSGSFTTTAPNDIIVAGDYLQHTTTGPGSGYTQRFITATADIWEDRIAATAGSYTATAPINTTSWWIMQAAAFKAAPDATDGGVDATGGTGGSAGSGGSSGSGGSAGSSGTGGTSGTAGSAGSSGSGGSSGTGGSSGSGGSGGTGGTGGSVVPATFPLVYSADHRTLQDQTGAPFPILGRASWSIITLSTADRQTYFDDLISKGFDAIEMGVIWRHPNTNVVPFAGNGSAPFLKQLNGANWDGHLSYSNINVDGPDMTTPNPTYWSFVDDFVADAAARGILILMFPSYVGYPGTGQGWMDEMVANGPTRVMTYGNFVGDRYKNAGNIVWMAAGDQGNNDQPFTSAQQTAEWGLLIGVNSVPSKKSVLWSAEWRRGSIGTDQSVFAPLMTLNSTYVFDNDVVTQGRRAYGFSPFFPSFLLEEPYDDSGATQPVRRFEWWGFLSTIGGYMAGDEDLWPVNPGWQSFLNTQNEQDLARLNAFVRSIPWQQLVLSGLGGMKTLCTAGCGTTTDVIAPAATLSGSLLVAYVPPAHSGTFTIDMTAMAGSTTARWFNPATAAYTTIGTFSNTGTHVFTPPGDNGSGFDDWTLVLTSP